MNALAEQAGIRYGVDELDPWRYVVTALCVKISLISSPDVPLSIRESWWNAMPSKVRCPPPAFTGDPGWTAPERPPPDEYPVTQVEIKEAEENLDHAMVQKLHEWWNVESRNYYVHANLVQDWIVRQKDRAAPMQRLVEINSAGRFQAEEGENPYLFGIHLEQAIMLRLYELLVHKDKTSPKAKNLWKLIPAELKFPPEFLRSM